MGIAYIHSRNGETESYFTTNKRGGIMVRDSFEWQHIRHLVDTYEDMQSVRTAEMNRARALVYRRLLELGYAVEAKKDEVTGKPVFNDKKLKKQFELAIKEGKLTKQEIAIFSDNAKYALTFKRLEADLVKQMVPRVEAEPIWQDYLSKLRGVGPLTSIRLICYLGDCERFDTISKLWAYCGFRVNDGLAQRRKKGEQSNWNPKLKKMGYQIGDVFVKQRTSYRDIYDKERERIRRQHPERVVYDDKWDGVHEVRWNDGHVHAMALRKMVKVFLANYWLYVRKMHGLPTRMPYAMEYEGHTTFQAPEEFFESREVRPRKKKEAA